MASDDLRVPIGIPVETNASTAADSIQALRDSVTRSKDAIKESAAAMRDLRGKSDDVKAAKDQLTAKIRAEEASVTKATLALIKQGAGYDTVKKAAKVAEKGVDGTKAKAEAMSKAISTAGGPVASLRAKMGSLNDMLGGTEGGMAAVAGIAALAAAAIVAVGAAAVSAAVSLGKFILASADAARMMQLTRKANLNGNDQWAKNLGDQIDAMARSIPIAKDKLNELGISLAKSRIGGQTMVDTMKAVGGATAAAGEDLGNKLKGIVERGALTRRFQLSPQELMGMDLDFTEVAQAYAKGMHVSVDAARKALMSGRMKLSDGAKALKDAVDAKFGEINTDKMLGLDNQLMKFKQDLAGLAKDVNIKPILEGIKSLAANFDQTNVNGKALRGIITTIGNAIGAAFKGGVPVLQDFIDKAVWGALKLENYWLRADLAFRKLTKGLSLGSAIGESFVKGLGMAISGDSAVMTLLNVWETKGPKAAENCRDLRDAITGLNTDVKNMAADWVKAGASIIDGIIDGIESGALRLVSKVKGLADDVKKAFTSTLRIQSPSKVFEAYGRNTTDGYIQGIEAGTPTVQVAASRMAPTPGAFGSTAPVSSGASRGDTTITFSPQIVVQGAGGDVREQLKDPSLLQALTETFLAQIRAAGIEVPG